MAQRKVRAKDLKKQRWAGIIAAILALAMIASLAGVYLAQTAGSNTAMTPEQHTEPEPEDYLDYYQGEVDRLEDYLDAHEPSEAVILELSENYQYLIFIQQAFFNNQEAVEEAEARLISLHEMLIDMEPDKAEYRLELLRLYIDQQKEEEIIKEEVAVLQEMLQEQPSPLVHLSLIGLLASIGEDELFQQELNYLEEHLESKINTGTADNEEKFYYALLLGEYRNASAEAEDILNQLIEEEGEGSWIYQEANNYLNHLGSDREEEIIVE